MKDKSNVVAVMFVLVFLQIMGLWTINDAFSLSINDMEESNVVGNGFWFMGMIQAFHMGLYMVIGSAAGMFMLLLHVVRRYL